MRPDKNTVKQLLELSDEELLCVIRKICADNRIDISSMKIGLPEIGILRAVLANASDEDIGRFLKYLGGGISDGRKA